MIKFSNWLGDNSKTCPKTLKMKKKNGFALEWTIF